MKWIALLLAMSVASLLPLAASRALSNVDSTPARPSTAPDAQPRTIMNVRLDERAKPQAADIQAEAIRFAAVDVVIDTNGEPLAVYQVDLKAKQPGVKIVSIEGGAHAAFRDPPRYDPKALQNERAILAAFNTADADNLPTGRIVVATLHLQIAGDAEPVFDAKLDVCATVDGEPIKAKLSVEPKRTQS